MDALVMCGGRGTRLGGEGEKPLVEVGDRPMVDRVVDALAGSRASEIHAAVSSATPQTRGHLAADERVAVVDTPGDGYVADLDAALDSVGRPAVTVVADLPLLAARHVDGAVEAAVGTAETAPDAVAASPSRRDAGGVAGVVVCVPAALQRRLGVSTDATFERAGETLAPTGLNVVADGTDDRIRLCDDVRLAVNVNRPRDRRVAAALLEGD